jgi:hypothetical protein
VGAWGPGEGDFEGYVIGHTYSTCAYAYSVHFVTYGANMRGEEKATERKGVEASLDSPCGISRLYLATG